MGRGPAGEPDSAEPMARQGMAVGSWRPVKLQHRWGFIVDIYLSLLTVCSWTVCSWDEELQKDINCLFIFIPPNQQRTLG